MTEQEVLDFVEENDVKFIRLAFVDLFGTLKNISIMPTQLHRALSGSVSFDASAVKGFCDISHSELFLRPDPKTITLLPWRPQTGRVARMMCDCLLPDGTLFTGYSRSILRQQVEKAKSLGLTFQIGTEYEFYLFQSDDAGEVTLHPQDCAGYMDVSPLDKGENVRRDICLTLENMGIIPESSHHEHGPGQNEIDFQYAGALKAADNAMSFKTTVRTIANQYGLCASFLPKPLRDESGNGLHINLSIERGGINIFEQQDGQLSLDAQHAIAGILGRKGQMIKYKGTTLYPPALFDILDNIPSVKNYIIEVYSNELGTEEILIRIGGENRSEAFAKEIKDLFRSKVRVAPSINFESAEYIAKIQMPPMSRKTIKFIDLR